MKANNKKYEEALKYLEVHEDGSVWRNERVFIGGNDSVHHQPRMIAKTRLNEHGYLITPLKINGKSYLLTVHRLVATVFIPKPEGWDETWDVNHIDGNKQNNAVLNLEWCTQSENMLHAYRTGLNQYKNEDKRKPVEQIDLSTGEVIATYASQSEAARAVGGNQTPICRCCLGKQHSHAGYGWRYVS